jgi:hypothetical protein
LDHNLNKAGSKMSRNSNFEDASDRQDQRSLISDGGGDHPFDVQNSYRGHYYLTSAVSDAGAPEEIGSTDDTTMVSPSLIFRII